MVELHSFFLLRPDVDDIMLIPNIVQKMKQIRVSMIIFHSSDFLNWFILKVIMERTKEKIYEALNNKENINDCRSFIRNPCASPVVVKRQDRKSVV